jgi:hypothetical protein
MAMIGRRDGPMLDERVLVRFELSLRTHGERLFPQRFPNHPERTARNVKGR